MAADRDVAAAIPPGFKGIKRTHHKTVRRVVALRSGRGGGRRDSGFTDGEIVRRLMPVECERLQGFPDGWTDLGYTADTPRYSAMGDAVTVPVAEWIGGRL